MEWISDKHLVYIAGNQLIGWCDHPYVIAEKVRQYDLSIDEELPIQRLAEQLLQAPEQYLLSFVFVLLSTMLSVIRSLNLAFQGVLYLTGPQGKGKTTLAAIVSGWLQELVPSRPALFFEASSTDAATREAMTRFRDLPIVTDDICRSASKTTERKRIEHGAMLVREGANAAKVIKKGRKGETVRLECVAGLILTAEFELENASDVTRCVFVPVERQMITQPELNSQLIGGSAVEFLRCFCLERYVRNQPGYGDWTLNKITRELKDYGALVTQEDKTAQVYLKKDLPRVYRIRMDVLKKNIEEY